MRRKYPCMHTIIECICHQPVHVSLCRESVSMVSHLYPHGSQCCAVMRTMRCGRFRLRPEHTDAYP